MEKFDSHLTFSLITKICELLTNIGVPYDVEMFSKNKNNGLVNNKIMKDAYYKRYGYKTFRNLSIIKLYFFSDKLCEIKVCDFNNYEWIFKAEIYQLKNPGNKCFFSFSI